MNTAIRTTIFLVALSLSALLTGQRAAAKFDLESGDRVVFLGDGLIEGEQYFGWIEVMLTTSFPDRDVTFRNLGWNADTPAGDSRFGLSLLQAGHEPADEAWKQLQSQLALTNPTVVILGYGMTAAIEASVAAADGDQDEESAVLERFGNQYLRLVDTIRAKNPDTRFVFLSPLKTTGPTVLKSEIVDWISEFANDLAKENGDDFVDLRKVLLNVDNRKDAVHLNGEGYRAAAIAMQDSLRLSNKAWRSSDFTESLRDAIIEKNRWWFHRSRPANMAYVFGFRKHEQGQNAVEIPQFDELIGKEEKRIARLRKLRPLPFGTPAKRMKSKYAKFTPQPHPDFTVAENLEVTLWAENPMLNKPIHMNFDPEGRLWIASSEAYPMIEVGQTPPDKILVLEDTTGDGTADKSTVFADGLLIPTGVAPGDGGVYVAQSTDLLFLKDTDGDGVADSKTRVLSGFGTEDTHHNLHTLRWGPDGRLYMNQSVYTRTDAETPQGIVRLKAGGGFRYSTKSKWMQIFFRGLWNSWGHQFDRYGNSVMTDGAGFAGIAYVFPGATFNPAPGSRRVMDLISPGKYPKFCSGEIVYGDSFPKDWQGSMVTCDFRANRVTRFKLIEQDSGFVTEQADDLIRTSQSSFRPIDVKQGPDGALYVADWSNPIINHGEVDFRDPRRDRWHGRIWRIAVKDSETRKHKNLREMDNEQLLEILVADDRFLSDQSRRVLVERGMIVWPTLKTWIVQQKNDKARLQGLWLSQGIDMINREMLQQLLKSENASVRSAAVRVLSDWSDPRNPLDSEIDSRSALRSFQKLINDPHPRVRLESVRGLSKLRSAAAAELALSALDHPMDRFIDFALYLTVNEQSDGLMKRVWTENWVESTPNGKAKLEFFLTSIPAGEATQFLREYLTKNPIAKSGDGPWIELLAKAGDKQQLTKLYEQVISDGFDESATARALTALSTAQRQRRIRALPPAAKPFKDLGRFFRTGGDEVNAAAIRLAGDWKVGGAIESLKQIAISGDRSPGISVAAVGALRQIGNAAAKNALAAIANDPNAIQRIASVSALAALDTQAATKPFFEILANIEDEATAVALWRDMLAAKGAEAVLVGSLPEKLSEVAARSGVRVAQEGGRNARSLAEALLPMSGMTVTADQWSPEKSKEILSMVKQKGDPARGEMVYLREKLQCVTCHAIGGIGGKVGPDLTSLGASAPVDYIIESMYDPNAKIKENYHSVVILTDDGRVITGVESGSTADEIVVRDASNKLIRIPASQVEAKRPGKSLMPLGLLDRVNRDDQIDLISFLTQLGKPGPFDASRQTVARRVDVLAGTHRLEQEGIDDVIAGKPVPKGRAFSPWKPIAVRLSGVMNAQQLLEATKPPTNISLVNIYLRTTVQSASPGKAQFEITGAKKAKLWIDGNEVEHGESANQFQCELAAGQHAVLIQIDARQVPETVSIKSDDVAFVGDEAP